jgi:hypothetical protein
MFRPLLGHHLVNFEYRSYLIKTLSIVAKQKVLLFTVNITRNRMQNPIINILFIFKLHVSELDTPPPSGAEWEIILRNQGCTIQS